ncbi:MAG: Crp/Fnr family transcriptional regulator [Lachnospiraceae bacterium]|nr:Crp/Fnr family transcriptional regulator [Lachnospiraceae bacterium]
MTLEELQKRYPDTKPYFETMPEELRSRYTIRTYPPGTIIHQKEFELNYFGIVCHGDHRVINEFENGNVFMIEKNEAIDFVGEVTILAGQKRTSVTIETLTECVVFMISRADFEAWIAKDIHFLRLIAEKIAFKLYRSSYNRGAKLFYPPAFLLLDYLLKFAASQNIEKTGSILLKKTRQEIQEELGMTVKTINRTISRLKEAGLIDTCKGKITMTLEQYKKSQKEITYYVN